MIKAGFWATTRLDIFVGSSLQSNICNKLGFISLKQSTSIITL
jgi:hypothetical protein